MFYYPQVLKRHSGCFSTIWLVATKGIRVPRRDFLKVNVENTCDDIMSYVLEQVPPPRPGLPRPRFSLYLSSQLQYGVVIVYHRQCAILLEELQAVVGQLVKQKTSQKIDMDDHSRYALDFPDALCLLEETEGAPDPLFGVMQDTMPSPNTLIQMGQEYPRKTSSPAAASPPAAPQSDTTASPETITLRESEPVTIPAAEFEGADLLIQLPDTLDILMAQTDDFPEGDLETAREEVIPGEEEREIERGGTERDLEKERTKELTGSTFESQPTTLSSEDAILSAQEEPGLYVVKPRPPTDQLTPVSVPLPTPPSAAEKRKGPELEDAPAPQGKTRKRRKRQLIFFDPETQLSPEELQQQIDNPQIETRPPVFPPKPSHRMTPAAELLDNPCTPLPEEVLRLWRRAATMTPVSGQNLQVGERGPESTDSEKERDGRMVEAADREEERHELSPKEVPRDLAESEMFQISDQSSLPLEASVQREVSREISPMFTPERERSPIPRSVSSLQDILEVQERAAEESPGLQPELPEHEVELVFFQSLLSPEDDRRTVSKIFQRLLENLSARRLRAEQDEPYGDILIFPGQNYEEVDLNL